MNVEDELRTVLRDRAAEEAPHRDLLDLVESGVRRDRRRRATLAGGAVALALAAVVAVPVALRGKPMPPSILPATTAATASASPSVVAWGPPRWPQPVFPLTPTWVPPGVGTPEVGQMGPNTLLSYDQFSAEIGPLPAAWETEAEQEHQTTVNGRQATVHTASSFDSSKPGERFVGIRWQLADGRWVTVLSWGKRTEAQVKRYAESLRPGTVNAPAAPFTIAAVPPGLTLQHQSTDMMCLAPPADPTKTPSEEDAEALRQPHGLCLTLLDKSTGDAGLTSIEALGGRRGGWFDGSFRLDAGDGRIMEFSWNQEELPTVTADDVVRLAAGTQRRGG